MMNTYELRKNAEQLVTNITEAIENAKEYTDEMSVLNKTVKNLPRLCEQLETLLDEINSAFQYADSLGFTSPKALEILNK